MAVAPICGLQRPKHGIWHAEDIVGQASHDSLAFACSHAADCCSQCLKCAAAVPGTRGPDQHRDGWS